MVLTARGSDHFKKGEHKSLVTSDSNLPKNRFSSNEFDEATAVWFD